MDNTGLDSGRYLSLSDADGVVLGNRIATQMFSQEITVNSKVTIEGKVFTVVGILKTGGQSDGTAFITKETARTLLNQPGKKVSSISVKVVDSSQVETVANATADRLDITRHVQQGKQDFTITTAQSVQSQISSITGTFTLFLTAIASISLLVGAIGISNTMFTSVMERTRQIGILKSLGATDGEVMKIFVAEASLIGLLGGVLGVLAGISAAGFISELGLRIGFQGAFTAMIDPGLIAMAILFSVVIGAVSGIFPARRAANMQPVEALRYE
jgi:putative ABC transport system permease protein